jgi:hypothetical protein
MLRELVIAFRPAWRRESMREIFAEAKEMA